MVSGITISPRFRPSVSLQGYILLKLLSTDLSIKTDCLCRFTSTLWCLQLQTLAWATLILSWSEKDLNLIPTNSICMLGCLTGSLASVVLLLEELLGSSSIQVFSLGGVASEGPSSCLEYVNFQCLLVALTLADPLLRSWLSPSIWFLVELEKWSWLMRPLTWLRLFWKTGMVTSGWPRRRVCLSSHASVLAKSGLRERSSFLASWPSFWCVTNSLELASSGNTLLSCLWTTNLWAGCSANLLTLVKAQ